MSALALKKTPIPTRRSTRLRLTAEEYLAIERDAQYKSEYWDGQLFPMNGGNRSHNRIVSNLIVKLGIQLKTRYSSVYANNMRVRVPEPIAYTYPDVLVTCGEESFADEHFDVLLNPIVIIEVLSKSTEAYDRGRKFQHYQQIPSLAAYLLVSQESYHVELYVKQSDKLWLYSSASDPEEVIILAAINCKLWLKQIYAKVKIEPEEEK